MKTDRYTEAVQNIYNCAAYRHIACHLLRASALSLVITSPPAYALEISSPASGDVIARYMDNCNSQASNKPANAQPLQSGINQAILNCLAGKDDDPIALTLRADLYMERYAQTPTTADFQNAIKDSCRAADMGFVIGQLRCGWYISYEQRQEESIKWIRLSAENGARSARGHFGSLIHFNEPATEEQYIYAYYIYYTDCLNPVFNDSWFGHFYGFSNDRQKMAIEFAKASNEKMIKECLSEADRALTDRYPNKLGEHREKAIEYAYQENKNIAAQLKKYPDLQSLYVPAPNGAEAVYRQRLPALFKSGTTP